MAWPAYQKGKPIEHSFDDLAHFSEKQLVALSASKKFKYVFYGGAMGGGKSYWIRWTLVYWLLRFWGKKKLKGVRVGLFCEDYPALKERHISKVKYEFPEWLGTYHEQDHEFRFHKSYGEGVICFRNLDDPSRYQSSEFALIAVDELPKNPISTFTMLRTRLRWPGVAKCRFISGGNPGGEAWVRQYFVDRNFPDTEKETQEYTFVQALPTDNPYLPQSYFASLESLPEAERKAFLEGDWASFDSTVDERGYARLLTDIEVNNARTTDFKHVGEKVLAVDPAAGGDRSAVVLASNTMAEVLFNQQLVDTMALVSLVLEYADTHHVRVICIDVTGVGQGVYDRLREITVGLPYEIRPIVFGGKSTEPTKYKNVKAEIFWKMREWLQHGGKLKNNDAWGELSTIKWKADTDRLTEMQPKSELRAAGLPSPNVADALAMAVFDAQIQAESAEPETGKTNVPRSPDFDPFGSI
jgi:hypothetical protein